MKEIEMDEQELAEAQDVADDSQDTGVKRNDAEEILRDGGGPGDKELTGYEHASDEEFQRITVDADFPDFEKRSRTAKGMQQLTTLADFGAPAAIMSTGLNTLVRVLAQIQLGKIEAERRAARKA